MRVSIIIPYTPRDRDLFERAHTHARLQTWQGETQIVPVFDEHYQGIPWARNTGLEQCTGEFILPLDCDDWIEPTYLEKTVPLMTGNVGIVSTHMIYFGEREGTIIKTNKRTYDAQLQYNNIPVCSLVRAEALRQAGPWDPNLRGWEDWDMWLRILKLGWEHTFVDEVLFHYRMHSGGMNQWANENKQTLRKYLNAKHPGFMELRKTGALSEDGTWRYDWNEN